MQLQRVCHDTLDFIQVPGFPSAIRVFALTHSRRKVPDERTAVTIAEAILFPIYGEKNIRDQRPYVVKHAEGKWTIDGILPQGMVGGTFHIVIRQRDAQILEIGHGA
jgi:hypothetical protein